MEDKTLRGFEKGLSDVNSAIMFRDYNYIVRLSVRSKQCKCKLGALSPHLSGRGSPCACHVGEHSIAS